MIARATTFAYGFLAVALLLVMFATSSVALMLASMFGAAACIGRGLYWRSQSNKPATRTLHA